MDPREIKCDCVIPRYLESYNVYTGKGDVIRLCCLARAIEDLTGKQFVYEFDVPENEIRDWDTDQRAKKQKRDEEIARFDARVARGDVEPGEERPMKHVTKTPPAWVSKQIAKRREMG